MAIGRRKQGKAINIDRNIPLYYVVLDFCELESNMFLLGYGAVMLAYAGAFFLAKRGRDHERYLQYRTLSEVVRTQVYISAAGIEENVGNSFTWTQQQEAAWVKKALSALLTETEQGRRASVGTIKEHWIDVQLAYHKSTLGRDSGKHRNDRGIAGVMLMATVLLFAISLVLEFFFPQIAGMPLIKGPFSGLLMLHGGETIAFRELLKILLGIASAITAFLSNYYGKLSLDRKIEDHRKMAELYTMAGKQLERNLDGQEALLVALSREEIIEIGNWFSYCKEDGPSFNA